VSGQARSTLRLVTAAGGGEPDDIRGEQAVTLHLDDFAWETIEEQSAELGVSVEELATHALLYYLADLDSGRIARQAPGT
jgi:hypothetical protein